MAKSNVKTLNHVEDISELLQMDSAMEQDLYDAVMIRFRELVKEKKSMRMI